MKSLFITLTLLLFLGCQPVFKLRKANIEGLNISKNCEGLITLIDTSWYKHKSRNCHLYHESYKEIESKYKNCLIGRSKQEIEQLFGKPDESDERGYDYIFHSKCPEFYRMFYSVSIGFHDNKVYNVMAGQSSKSH